MSDPIAQRISEAQGILTELGFPSVQSNERSALALLVLLDLRPGTPWAQACTPLRGISEMMQFMSDHYCWVYAPNTRETVRRQTIQQLCAAGLTAKNPDDHNRPTNSPKTVYQVIDLAWRLAKAYGTGAWSERLATYLEQVGTLADQLERQRQLRRIPEHRGASGSGQGLDRFTLGRVQAECCPSPRPSPEAWSAAGRRS